MGAAIVGRAHPGVNDRSWDNVAAVAIGRIVRDAVGALVFVLVIVASAVMSVLVAWIANVFVGLLSGEKPRDPIRDDFDLFF